MAVQIHEACWRCGACIWECPVEAISPGEERPVVDTQACTECYGFFGESQCLVVCPAPGAIRVKPESTDILEQRFAYLHPGRQLQDTWIWRRFEQ